MCALAIPAHSAVLIVSNANDSGPGSLRQALAAANDGDTIDATGILGVITLTSGQLLVTKSVAINGAGADLLAVDGNATSRLFQVGSGKTVTISGLTIRNGHDDTTGGGIDNQAGATLAITNSTLGSNSAGSVGNPAVAGGGIFNNGTLTIVNSTFSANTAGGISGAGGGIFNGGTLTISNSTFSGNTASKGGGVYHANAASTVTITNSTFSGNSALSYGGACFNGGTMQITNSTLSGNSAITAGGILVFGPLQIGNTVLNSGDSGATIDSFGEVTVISLGNNLSSDDARGHLTGPGDQINTDPVLGPLQDNGGPSFTHALLPGSPAIDTGNPNTLARDQRYYLRNGSPDRGAFEFAGTLAPLSATSRKIHGATGAFDVDLPLSGNAGIECRSGGSNGDYQLIMTFATLVTLSGASVTSGVGNVSNTTVTGSQVTANLTDVANAQRIELTLFGVNDGANTNNVSIPMGVLLGDVSGNGTVNASDTGLAKSHIGEPIVQSNFRADTNASGDINATDAALVKSRLGTSLP
ncbi:MAG: choice-of-anchor Q domain-containing protein [Chthoniobacterales bacterium]